MLWLLPLDAGPVRVRLDPGVYVVPRWYDEAELGVLVEVLRRVLEPVVLHAVVLPVDALATEAWARASLDGPVLLAIRGELEMERRSELGRWAREHRHHVLVRARADEDELSTGWLERWVKPAVVWLLERGAWAQGHPLDAFGIEGLAPDGVARVTEDPVELLWLVERMLGHRLRYAEQGVGEKDYARSLGHAVGERCAERLRRYGEGVNAALDVIVGGAQSKEGWAALVKAGLGVWREGVFARGPLLRAVEEDWAVVEVIVGGLGEEVLSAEAKEVMKGRRQAAERTPRIETVQPNETSSTFDEGLLAAALRMGLKELPDSPELLGEVVNAIERWENMRWSQERIDRLKELRLRLRDLRNMPSAAHRWFSRAESHVLVILTTNDLAEARSSRNALLRLLSMSLTGWKPDLLLNATLECARRHRNQGASKEDFELAEGQLHEVIQLGERSRPGRPWHVAEARRHLAELAIVRGDLDAALLSLREDVAPAFERLGDLRSMALAMGPVADILVARGDLDQALHIHQHDVLPVFERLGDIRGKALTLSKIADILAARGDLDQALHIQQHDVLPVFERLGEARAKAITLGNIAEIFQAQGDLDRALHIRKHDELPIYERLGDLRTKAITMSQIADILHARGDLDQALQIQRQEVLPVYERLGDLRGIAVTASQIAAIRLVQGDDDARAEATRLLSDAYQTFARMRLPVADRVLDLAARYGLDLDAPSPEGPSDVREP